MIVFEEDRDGYQNIRKRPTLCGRLGSFWFSARPSADTGTDYNLHHLLNSVKRSETSEHSVVHWLQWMVQIIISACVCRRPSWTPKPQPNDSSQLLFDRVFGVQLDSLEKKKCSVFNWSRKRTHEVACQGGIGFLENEGDRGGSFPYVFEVSLEW